MAALGVEKGAAAARGGAKPSGLHRHRRDADHRRARWTASTPRTRPTARRTAGARGDQRPARVSRAGRRRLLLTERTTQTHDSATSTDRRRGRRGRAGRAAPEGGGGGRAIPKVSGDRVAQLGPLIALILACIFFTTQSDRFLDPANFSLIIQQVMVIGTLAIGQTLIILTAGIDLSCGTAMALGSIVMTKLAVDSRRAAGAGDPARHRDLHDRRLRQRRARGRAGDAAVHRDAGHVQHLPRADAHLLQGRDDLEPAPAS